MIDGTGKHEWNDDDVCLNCGLHKHFWTKKECEMNQPSHLRIQQLVAAREEEKNNAPVESSGLGIKYSLDGAIAFGDGLTIDTDGHIGIGIGPISIPLTGGDSSTPDSPPDTFADTAFSSGDSGGAGGGSGWDSSDSGVSDNGGGQDYSSDSASDSSYSSSDSGSSFDSSSSYDSGGSSYDSGSSSDFGSSFDSGSSSFDSGSGW